MNWMKNFGMVLKYHSRVAALTVLVTAGIGLPGNLLAAPEKEPAKPAGLVLDSSSSYWRLFYVLRPPVVRSGTELKKLQTITDETPPPPREWAQPDFDDSMWARVAGKPLVNAGPSSGGITEGEGSSPSLALICMRGKFGVSEPTAVSGLKVSINYRGGVIVYVNGKEVGRANMAKDANGPDALAEDYPKEAFLNASGSPEITVKRGDSGSNPTFDARARTAAIAIPASALRKGSNFIAVEIHRAAYSGEMYDAIQKKKLTYQLYGIVWATCGLNSISLGSSSTSGLTPNLSRPKGFQVWNSQLMQADFDLDYGDPFEPLRPINIVGARAGTFSGKVVVGCDQPVRNIKAQISDLTGSKGTIPAAAVQVRYAMPTGEEPVLEKHFPCLPDLMDGLAEVPPATVEVRSKKGGAWPFGAVCPVWVTVAVPEKAAAGDYAGKLTISADGMKATEVPVAVKVCNWRVPKPSEFHTVVDIMQSPETVAMQYNVPIYSDKHFKLLEKSLTRAGYVGTWTLHIPLICRSNLGNDQSMVRWIRKPDGSYKYDFSVLDKYLELANKNMGKPRAIDLVVWDLFLGFQGLEEAPHFIDHNTKLDKGFQPTEVPVSMLDEASGKIAMGMVGCYDDKSKANWKALVDQLMPILKKYGVDKSLHIGHSYDLCPTEAIVKFWSELLPGVNYMRYGHYDYDTFGKSKWKSDFIVAEWMPEWSATPKQGWKTPGIHLPWIRLKSDRGSGLVWKADPYVTIPVAMFRVFPECCIQHTYRGFGRMGLDFWPVLDDEKGRKNMFGLQGRYPTSSWRQSDEIICCIVPPGPDGALSSSKLEILHEGLQETEARIAIEKAGKGGKVLDGRVNALRPILDKQPVAGFDPQLRACFTGYSFGGMLARDHSAIFQQWFLASGWQERSEQLFNAAPEISAP